MKISTFLVFCIQGLRAREFNSLWSHSLWRTACNNSYSVHWINQTAMGDWKGLHCHHPFHEIHRLCVIIGNFFIKLIFGLNDHQQRCSVSCRGTGQGERPSIRNLIITTCSKETKTCLISLAWETPPPQILSVMVFGTNFLCGKVICDFINIRFVGQPTLNGECCQTV